ncbi:hypothetical protein F4810DRAFT_668184 [Camillea tinctor]|nr:hypothetical protein F4810DRAFT_668184 [Camillea tinctor]
MLSKLTRKIALASIFACYMQESIATHSSSLIRAYLSEKFQLQLCHRHHPSLISITYQCRTYKTKQTEHNTVHRRYRVNTVELKRDIGLNGPPYTTHQF